MEEILILISVIGFVGLVFIFTHLRPLAEDEIKQLGEKRRRKQIRGYFSFDKREFDVDKEFKKRMNPNGAFYRRVNAFFS